MLSDHCNYGTLHDEMIRNRIVVGIRDCTLSEKLQLDTELTLTTAAAKVHQAEQVAALVERRVSCTWEETLNRSGGSPGRKKGW